MATLYDNISVVFKAEQGSLFYMAKVVTGVVVFWKSQSGCGGRISLYTGLQWGCGPWVESRSCPLLVLCMVQVHGGLISLSWKFSLSLQWKKS